jgi:hypothetical protein
MKSRDLGVLLFGLAGLYSLLLAVSGLADLLLQVAQTGVVVAGQLRIQGALISGAVGVLAHLGFGAALLAGRRKLADGLLAGAGDGPLGAGAGDGAAGVAVAGVCAVAILLLARVVTALTYGTSLLFVRGNPGDLVGWSATGILVDLLVAATGVLLLARRERVVARLLAAPLRAGGGGSRVAGGGGARAGGGDPGWQLPALRFLGLALVAWHLPALASALSAFVKWWLRPEGFDLRRQALEHLPPAATGVLAGLYLLLLFPAGLGRVWKRLRPPAGSEE